MRGKLRPIDLARSAGISAQMVRKYERWRFIPPAERSEHGYRQYSNLHMQALHTARTMISGYGWMTALRIMQHVHQQAIEEALALSDSKHSELHQERRLLRRTLQALDLATSASTMPELRRKPEQMHIGQVAMLVGVQDSTLRFWEQQGLLSPDRDPSSNYRSYRAADVLRAQVIAILRRAGYAGDDIRSVLLGLDAGRPQQAMAAAERRLQELSEQSRRLLAAGGVLHEYLLVWEDHTGGEKFQRLVTPQ